MMRYNMIHADILRWLTGNEWLVQNGHMPKFHAIFGDTPYALEFMGKGWDTHDSPQAYQAWVTSWAKPLLSYAHPGALLALYGGTRTYHRIVAGLEDAGWIVGDEIAVFAYLYGSGFPKSLDISRAIDKEAGAERTEGKREWTGGQRSSGIMGENHGTQTRNIFDAPATPDAARWQGYGTALKPSRENIVIARAPRQGHTYAELARMFGTGAINIDGCRLDVADDEPNIRNNESRGGAAHKYQGILNGGKVGGEIGRAPTLQQGRWPANTVFACECAGAHEAGCPVAELGRQSGESVSKAAPRGGTSPNPMSWYQERSDGDQIAGHDDSGNAARFFYQAKAASWEKQAGLSERNPHPTIKPLKLNEYIARLLLPPELDTPRRILIPFAGVASEMIGALLAGWDEVVGVELTAEYVPIAEQRLKWWSRFPTYSAAERSLKSADTKPVATGQLSLWDAAS